MNIPLPLRWFKAILVAVMLLHPPVSQADPGSPASPEQVINSYLDYLVDGNVTQLYRLLGGDMKRNNRQLLASPDNYSDFLKSRYAGVITTVEALTERGNKFRARVRFEYPTGENTTTVFVLTGRNGQWRITDELY